MQRGVVTSAQVALLGALVGAMGGCNLLTTPTATSTPVPTDHAAMDLFTGKAVYTGQIMVFMENPNTQRTITARFPTNSSGAKVATVSHDPKGNFQFENLGEASYQFTYEPLFVDKTTAAYAVQHAKDVTSATTNYLDVAATDPLSRPMVGKDHRTPGFMWEVGWKPQPSPALNASVTRSSAMTFTFSGFGPNDVMKGPFAYQVFVESKAATTSAHPNKWQWSSPYKEATTFTWNGKEGTETDSAAGEDFPVGAARYQIKFRTAGVTDGSKANGQSHWIGFSLQ